ncbi:MAG: hypothetical protein IH891_01380 [Planctomycetes bacterium]|nr:hypothetical protein [Planctomycetota bacterium]
MRWTMPRSQPGSGNRAGNSMPNVRGRKAVDRKASFNFWYLIVAIGAVLLLQYF